MPEKYQHLERLSQRLQKIKADAETARRDLEEARKLQTQVSGNLNSKQLSGGRGG